MRSQKLAIPDVIELQPTRHADERGNFAETFRDDWFCSNIGDRRFIQENQSHTLRRGTIRGLHFQAPPAAQGKLVQCLSGAIFDVAVDIRENSATYGDCVTRILTAERGNQLWVPEGFLHGFCTLTDDTVVAYKVTAYYDRSADRGVRWNDADLGIAWPDCVEPSLLSDKDRHLPCFRKMQPYFTIGSAA
ncbi:dTDP-4-dehydrorhamnose 3,5-epimerase [Devosia lucknowensis]|uniref:dTDP-4-dehydrorhamnose 3,5-epimerase n=1 Tax=Devosia lucknowensis TaxID=1096929 RepID=A0A1Y6FE55_9HYPH|nr:dTDP-4-dehydrorhamnose 3,5-epimerase [Devosia lucknowensis]SMQ72919.1 dTDP-4-dehydrorhamnose 3,5-epimerase [Devosia lucknowensis]